MPMTRRTLLASAGAAAALPRTLSAAEDGLPMSAPVSVGKVGLWARDAERLADWYGDRVGLRRMGGEGNVIAMGNGRDVLLEITEDSALNIAPPTQAGLYHTAFLLPSRRDLARWVLFAMDRQFPVDGVADHLVSEAIYLTDPEGNGVEIYADRPASDWVWTGGSVEMASNPIDFENLLATAGPAPIPWESGPEGTVVGHVHLKVGDASVAGDWWQTQMGFDEVRARQGAVFLSTGGYHHHIAVNQWQSAGASIRPEGFTGLAYVELQSRAPPDVVAVRDAWGTEIRVTSL